MYLNREINAKYSKQNCLNLQFHTDIISEMKECAFIGQASAIMANKCYLKDMNIFEMSL